MLTSAPTLQKGFPPLNIRSAPFLLMHLSPVLALFVPFSWSLVALAVGLYLFRLFFVVAGYHRYFSHRSFKTSRWFQFVIAFLACTAVQKGPIWWAAHHRRHHKFSDQYGDVHSPGLQGFVWAHVGWILATDWEETDYKAVPDLTKYRELVWLNDWHLVPALLFAATLYLVGGFPWLVWGFFVSTVLCWHITFTINSLTHMFGRRRYVTKDDSRNSLILAVLTLGEGWHNNHHYYQSSTRQGFYWWEVDLAYYLLRGFALVGLVWDLREPPASVVSRRVPAAAA